MALALASMLSVGAVATALATSTKIQAGDLIITLSGSTSPKKLPKNEYAPIVTNVSGKIKTSDSTHPSAFREIVADFDKDVKIDVKGFPVCKASQLEATNTTAAKRACGKTLLGSGSAHAEIAFPEQSPIKVASPLLIFNGGQKGSKTLLLIHTFITVPAPTAIVTTVTVQKKGPGLHMIAKIPVIAGGSGSALDFSFKLGKKYTYKGEKHSYLEAKCPDGVFKVNIPKVLFKNEAKVEGVAPITVLKGALAVPCTPKG